MNLKITKTKAVLLAALFVFTLTGCGSKQEDGTLLEDFSNMETMDFDGNIVDSSIFEENTLTVLNLWNLGCTPCIEELPAFEQLSKEFADKGVAIKGLYYDFGAGVSAKEEQEIVDTLANAEVTYQQIKTSPSLMQSKYLQNVQAFPSTLFIDSKGNVVKKQDGSNDYEGWKKIIEEVLATVESNEE